MVKLYSFSTDRHTEYRPENPLEISVNDLGNLRTIVPKMMGLEGKLDIPPIQTDILDGEKVQIGYRVVKKDGMCSLGLRRNPNIVVYKIGEWTILSENNIMVGPEDWGGIAICRTPSQANALKRYMEHEKGIPVRVFQCVFGDIMHHKDWRIKTDRILMYEEILK